MSTANEIQKLLRTSGWIIGLVVVVAVLGLQVLIFYSSPSNDVSSTIASLTAVYVAAMLVFGYAIKRLQSERFLAILFAGWSLLMATNYVISTSVGYAVIAGFTAICAVYYLYEWVV